MKYVIQINKAHDTGPGMLLVHVMSENAVHTGPVGAYPQAKVVGAGFCSLMPEVRVHGESESLKIKPHPADEYVLTLFFEGMLEQQCLLLAELYDDDQSS